MKFNAGWSKVKLDEAQPNMVIKYINEIRQIKEEAKKKTVETTNNVIIGIKIKSRKLAVRFIALHYHKQ